VGVFAKINGTLVDVAMIEAANLSDIEEISTIETQTFANPWSKQLITDSLHNNVVLVKRVGTQTFQEAGYDRPAIAAFLIAQIVLDEATVLQIAVDPSHQSQGHGRQLMSYWLETLNSEISKIWIEVRASNYIAQGLYSSLGFVKLSERKNYYKVIGSDQKETAYIYCLNRP